MKTQRSFFLRWERWVALPIFCCALVLSFATLAHGELYDDCDGDGLPDECPCGGCGAPPVPGGGCGCGGAGPVLLYQDMDDIIYVEDDYDQDGPGDARDNCPYDY